MMGANFLEAKDTHLQPQHDTTTVKARPDISEPQRKGSGTRLAWSFSTAFTKNKNKGALLKDDFLA